MTAYADPAMMREATVRIVSPTPWGFAASVTYVAMRGIAWSVNRQTARVATGQAPVRIAGQATESIPRQTASKATHGTTDEGLCQTVPGTTPGAGVSV